MAGNRSDCGGRGIQHCLSARAFQLRHALLRLRRLNKLEIDFSTSISIRVRLQFERPPAQVNPVGA